MNPKPKKQELPNIAQKVMPATKKKIKVLWYSDLLCTTGFGNVADAILTRLYGTGKYEVTAIGINYGGEPYNHPNSRFNHLKDVSVYPASDPRTPSDFLGKARLTEMISKEDFDILFVLQDTFNLVPFHNLINEARKNKTNSFKYVFYFPCDGAFKDLWVTNAIATADYPVVYTNYGKKEIEKIAPELAERTEVIYHGFDPNKFTPISESERQEFRDKYFKCGKDTIVVTNVNRNQPRKDPMRTIDAFVKFNKKYPNSKLYMHCVAKDQYGFALDDYVIKHYTPEERANIIFPTQEKMMQGGYPESFLNYIYASSDMVVSTTLGEGWGLSATEALACETPIVIPNNTSAPEIVGSKEERGYLVDCSKEHVTILHDNEHKRPLTNIDSLVEKMSEVADNFPEAKRRAKEGRKWLEQYNWDIIAKKFDDIFMEAYATLQEEKKKESLEKTETADEKIAKQKKEYLRSDEKGKKEDAKE